MGRPELDTVFEDARMQYMWINNNSTLLLVPVKGHCQIEKIFLIFWGFWGSFCFVVVFWGFFFSVLVVVIMECDCFMLVYNIREFLCSPPLANSPVTE